MKKRRKYTIIVMLLSLLLCGCSGKVDDRTVHEMAYDMDQAVAMIDEFEWDCAWLQTQETMSRSSAQALEKHLNSLIQDAGTQAVEAQLDGADWEDSSIKTLELVHDQNQPTVYHEGIEVVSATEECSCDILDGSDECRQHIGTLTIRKEYHGDDPRLKGWYLEYVFLQYTHNGEWAFSAYNGTYNTDAPLALRESFYNDERRHYALQNSDL